MYLADPAAPSVPALEWPEIVVAIATLVALVLSAISLRIAHLARKDAAPRDVWSVSTFQNLGITHLNFRNMTRDVADQASVFQNDRLATLPSNVDPNASISLVLHASIDEYSVQWTRPGSTKIRRFPRRTVRERLAGKRRIAPDIADE